MILKFSAQRPLLRSKWKWKHNLHYRYLLRTAVPLPLISEWRWEREQNNKLQSNNSYAEEKWKWKWSSKNMNKRICILQIPLCTVHRLKLEDIRIIGKIQNWNQSYKIPKHRTYYCSICSLKLATPRGVWILKEKKG
jgi:hypothetical protein